MTLLNGIAAAIVLLFGLGCWNSFRYYQNLGDSFDALAVRFLKVGFLLQILVLVGEWIVRGYAPLTTLDGILQSLSFTLVGALLVGRWKTPVPVLTSFFLPFVFLLSFVAFLSGWSNATSSENRWMTPGMASHIFLTILGFAHFTLGFGVGVAFWIQEGQLKQRPIKSWSYRLPALEILDSLTVLYIGLGLLFWVSGLSFGVFQAIQVWNRLPLDDPKIMGSFLVLLIYAFFFLLRWGFRMRGRKSMLLVMIGYFLALFTFVGVRVFLTTRHMF